MARRSRSSLVTARVRGRGRARGRGRGRVRVRVRVRVRLVDRVEDGGRVLGHLGLLDRVALLRVRARARFRVRVRVRVANGSVKGTG